MLNKRLDDLIRILDIKKGDFADRIQFTQAYISMILSGKKENPSDRFFESLKREFNVNPEWLKFGNGEMFLIDEKNLTTLETNLVQKYNSLTLSDRKIIDEIVDSLIAKNTLSEQNDVKQRQ